MIVAVAEELHTGMDAAATAVMRVRRGVRDEPEAVLDMAVGLGLFGTPAFLGFSQPADRGLIGRCMREGRPVLTFDVSSEPDYHSTEVTAPVHSELDVPVTVGGRSWGAITVQGVVPGAFDEEDARLLASVADQLAAALRAAALYEQLERAYLGTAEALSAALEAKDSYTAEHSRSLVQRAEAVGRLLEMDETELRVVRYGAAFHDIGKLAVPEQILNKPGPLTTGERKVVQRHTVVGEQILSPVEFLSDVLPLVRSAHECFDGSGYPDGLAGAGDPPRRPHRVRLRHLRRHDDQPPLPKRPAPRRGRRGAAQGGGKPARSTCRGGFDLGLELSPRPGGALHALPTLSPVRRILIVGSTGSIGTQALDVVERSDELEVVGLAADSSWELLLEQAARFGVERIALADADAAARAAEHSAEPVLRGAEGLVELITESDCDLVLNALVGSAGLGPTVATLGEGIDLALANKESLVVGGELVTALAEATGAELIPVDSEHSALAQLIAGERPGTIDKLVLTASGGPFRGRTDLEGITREEALAHPTWDMGGKITIDSATLMNKGLELIEAHHLFGVPYDRIDVVVHPQSIVHALVHLNDGASLAHLGYPDMRVPISYALHHPDRADVPVRALDLVELGALTFEAPDTETFACLRLARDAAAAGGTAPCVLNAANEVAVHAFLRGELSFPGIARVIESTLSELPARPVRHFSDLYQADSEAREIARGVAA